ncbi:hypothetical protein Ancab_037155 [Ancistrocladus abbreviatus]
MLMWAELAHSDGSCVYAWFSNTGMEFSDKTEGTCDSANTLSSTEVTFYGYMWVASAHEYRHWMSRAFGEASYQRRVHALSICGSGEGYPIVFSGQGLAVLDDMSSRKGGAQWLIWVCKDCHWK